MGLLKDFEGRLGRSIEGFFTKAFRSGLQPVELAKRILREMEGNRTVGVKEVWVPNRYVVYISGDDRQRFANMERSLIRELETVVLDGARQRGYGLVARPQVVFETDDALKRGDLRVEPELTESTGDLPREERRGPDTKPTPTPDRGRPRLTVVGAEERQFPLDKERAVIGRLAGSDIEIPDTGASRRHAEVRREGDRFVLVDLGSMNGTLVNESPISQHVLEDGDRISIGRTVLEFRSR